MNLLIQNTRILTPEYQTAEGSVCVEGNKIVSVSGVPRGFQADRVIDGAGCLVMPGLINCHTHGYATLFRNYADDLSFHEWLFDRIMPKEDMMTPEDAYWCTLLAAVEMIRSGTTCFLDMHMFRRSCMEAAAKAGMRAVFSRGLVGEDLDDPGARRRLDDLFCEMEEAKKYGGRISCMLGPHSAYTCGEKLLRQIRDIALEKNLRIHIHLAESEREFSECMEKNRQTPTAYLDRVGLFDAPTVAAHCVYLTDGDIEILSDKGVFVVTNPMSNMKLSNGFSPVPKLLKAGVNVAVGTDGASSNNTLNLFRELAALSLIHKGLEKDPKVLPARRALQIATAGGAKTLGFGEWLGKVAPGYAADLVLVDLCCPQMQPENDLPSALVYSANGSEVKTVIINGEIVMENRVLTNIDEREVYQEVGKIKKRLLG